MGKHTQGDHMPLFGAMPRTCDKFTSGKTSKSPYTSEMEKFRRHTISGQI